MPFDGPRPFTGCRRRQAVHTTGRRRCRALVDGVHDRRTFFRKRSSGASCRKSTTPDASFQRPWSGASCRQSPPPDAFRRTRRHRRQIIPAGFRRDVCTSDEASPQSSAPASRILLAAIAVAVLAAASGRAPPPSGDSGSTPPPPDAVRWSSNVSRTCSDGSKLRLSRRRRRDTEAARRLFSDGSKLFSPDASRQTPPPNLLPGRSVCRLGAEQHLEAFPRAQAEHRTPRRLTVSYRPRYCRRTVGRHGLLAFRYVTSHEVTTYRRAQKSRLCVLHSSVDAYGV